MCPWRGCLPFPDSTIDQADRQTVAFVYGGILAGDAVPEVVLFQVSIDLPKRGNRIDIPIRKARIDLVKR